MSFDVGGGDPKPLPGKRYAVAYHLLVDLPIGNELRHVRIMLSTPLLRMNHRPNRPIEDSGENGKRNQCSM